MRVTAKGFTAFHKIQFIVERIKKTLGMTFQKQQENVLWFRNTRPLSMSFELPQQVCTFVSFRRSWQYGLQNLFRLFIIMHERWMQLRFPKFFNDNEIINDGLTHKYIVFYNRRYFIPFWFTTMVECPTITKPIENRNRSKEHGRIECILHKSRRKCRKCKRGQ